jgi:hypothetical protein
MLEKVSSPTFEESYVITKQSSNVETGIVKEKLRELHGQVVFVFFSDDSALIIIEIVRKKKQNGITQSVSLSETCSNVPKKKEKKKKRVLTSVRWTFKDHLDATDWMLNCCGTIA